jgi:uncharacterized protein (TIRG00374 family)
MLIALGLGLPVSAVLLWLAVRNTDPAAVRRALEDARIAPVALALLAIAAVYWIQAVRWRSIASAAGVRRARFLEMVVSGVACNNVLPGRLGDLLRARWLGQEAKMPAGRALGTVVLDRGSDVVALFTLLVLGLLAVASSDWLLRIAVVTVVGLALLAALLVFARQYTRRRERERHGRGLIRRVARDAAELLAEPLGRRRPALWLGLSLAAWTCWAVAAILVARSVGIDLNLLEAYFVAAVMNLGVAIPSSPGFVGTYQWLGVSSLGLIDVGVDEALAFTIILHASWYVPTTLLGGLALVIRGTRGRAMRALISE